MKSSTQVFQAKMTAQLLRPTARSSFLRKSLEPDSPRSPFTNYVMGKCASVSTHTWHENENSTYLIGLLCDQMSNICKELKTVSCLQLVFTKCCCFSVPITCGRSRVKPVMDTTLFYPYNNSIMVAIFIPISQIRKSEAQRSCTTCSSSHVKG